MLALGVTADQVAQFVGHRSTVTTTSIYHRLNTEEMEAIAVGCPVFGEPPPDARTDLVERWQNVIRHMRQPPYEFSEAEWDGLLRGAK